VIEIRKTETFERWLQGLRDVRAVARINARIRRIALGNPGDVKPVREGVLELRIDSGPGYRIYFIQRGKELIILLAGGDKRTQSRDIEKAIALAGML
jgi:putative addiction module killer protein